MQCVQALTNLISQNEHKTEDSDGTYRPDTLYDQLIMLAQCLSILQLRTRLRHFTTRTNKPNVCAQCELFLAGSWRLLTTAAARELDEHPSPSPTDNDHSIITQCNLSGASASSARKDQTPTIQPDHDPPAIGRHLNRRPSTCSQQLKALHPLKTTLPSSIQNRRAEPPQQPRFTSSPAAGWRARSNGPKQALRSTSGGGTVEKCGYLS